MSTNQGRTTEVRQRTVAPKFAGCVVVCRSGIFFALKSTNIFRTFIDAHVNLPRPTSLVPANALVLAGARSPLSAVGLVLGMCHHPQIVSPIVKPISVDVVDDSIGIAEHVAMHPKVPPTNLFGILPSECRTGVPNMRTWAKFAAVPTMPKYSISVYLVHQRNTTAVQRNFNRHSRIPSSLP